MGFKGGGCYGCDVVVVVVVLEGGNVSGSVRDRVLFILSLQCVIIQIPY